MTGETSPASLEIREARCQDLLAIVRLLADDPLGAAREDASEPLAAAYQHAFDVMATSPWTEQFVAERDGSVVACAQLTVMPGLSLRGMTRAEIEGVRVAAALRGQGVGERLIRHLVERARERGCGLVQLTSNRTREEALRFYERLGFRASHVGLKLPLG